MNCTKIEKLLPLYVEGDLTEREASEVRSHLSSCNFCRNLSEEFAASQERIRNFAVPEFGAEFYERLRGSVLTEISSRHVERPSVFRTLFPARPALAASLATLVLFGALFSVALYRSLVKNRTTLTALEKSMADFNLDVLTDDEVPPINNAVVSNNAGVGKPGSTADNTVRRRYGRGTTAPVRPQTPAPQSIDSAGSTTASSAAQTVGAASDEASRQVVARMDIQTSDPNIRIIWLGRKASE